MKRLRQELFAVVPSAQEIAKKCFALLHPFPPVFPYHRYHPGGYRRFIHLFVYSFIHLFVFLHSPFSTGASLGQKGPFSNRAIGALLYEQ